ncbi:hypothetical protein NO758_02084 [Planktothrix agardhii]|nr:hypothetical protein NO758_02084 [Planktothrix agardhii]
MKVLVHIGYHKTGTSSLQKSLKISRSILAENGFLYPILDNKNQHWPLFPNFIDTPENHHLFKSMGIKSKDINNWLQKRIKELDEQIASFNGHTCILSAEDFSIIPSFLIPKFKMFLTDRFDSVKIIAYIRPAEDLYCSQLQQQAKAGKNVFITFPVPGKNSSIKAKISKYVEEFGLEQISVVKFSHDSLYEGDVVRDFFKRFIVTDDQSLMRMNLNSVYANESICGAATIALSLLSQEKFPRFIEKGQNPQWKELQQALMQLKPSKSLPKLSLPEQWKAIIKQNHQEEYLWLEDTFFNGNRGIFSNLDKTDISVPEEVTREQFQEWLMSYLTPEAWQEIVLHLWKFQSERLS